MSDYKERFDKWQKDAKEKFEEIDKQLGLKDKIEEGARVVVETAQKGAEKIKAEAEKTEVGKQAVKVAEGTIKTAESAAKKAWNASEPIRDAAEDAGDKAGEVVKEAGKTAGDVIDVASKTAGEVINIAGKKAGEVFDDAYETVGKNANRVSKAFNFGASWTRTIDSAISAFSKTSGWIQENPLQAATTGVSMAIGAGLGVVFTGISSHWLFNSALPAWSIKKIGEQFDGYLKTRETLIEKGELNEAETERVKFERDIARRIGAPLLGAFSFASGAVMMTNILNPKTITGAPIDWLIGGNPLLEGVWFFGNGMVCFKTSYDFFMIALEDQAEAQRLVKEIKGLLPEAITT
jgi:cell division septum initiation protein DivIVA